MVVSRRGHSKSRRATAVRRKRRAPSSTARFRSAIMAGCAVTLRAKTRSFKGDLDDKRSSSRLSWGVCGSRAKMLAERWRCATCAPPRTACPLRRRSPSSTERSRFPPKREPRASFAERTAEWTADFGDSRLEGSSASGNLVFTSERILGNLRGHRHQGQLAGKLPFRRDEIGLSGGAPGDPRKCRGDGAASRLVRRLVSPMGRVHGGGEPHGVFRRMGRNDRRCASRFDQDSFEERRGGAQELAGRRDRDVDSDGAVRSPTGRCAAPCASTSNGLSARSARRRSEAMSSSLSTCARKTTSHRTADVTGVVQARKVALSSKHAPHRRLVGGFPESTAPTSTRGRTSTWPARYGQAFATACRRSMCSPPRKRSPSGSPRCCL